MNTKQRKINFRFLDALLSERKGIRGKGLFYGIKFASRHARESTLLVFSCLCEQGAAICILINANLPF